MKNRNAAAPGFTLIELMFTVAIAAILMMVAMPSLHGLVAGTRQASAANALIHALKHGRSLAVTRGVPAVVCPSLDQRHCDPGTDWSHGWLVGSDMDQDGLPDLPVERVYQAPSSGINILGSKGRPRVRFLPDGSSPGSNISLIICQANDTSSATSIILSNPGRTRTGDPSPAQAAACAAA